jgi:hypothetical protein
MSCVLVLAVLVHGECVSVPEIREGTLEIVATSLIGEQISNIKVELFPNDNPIAKITTTSRTIRVPYGRYSLRVLAVGFGLKSLEVQIAQPETVVRLEFPVGAIGCPTPPASIGGRIKSEGGTADLWVKIIPVRGIGGGEARVSPSGYFLVSGLEHSTFLVLVMRGESVVHQQLVKTYPVGTDTSRLSIELRQAP